MSRKMFFSYCRSLDSVPQGLDDAELQGLGSDQGAGTDSSNSKLPEFANRPGKGFQKILRIVDDFVCYFKYKVRFSGWENFGGR